MKKIFFIIPSAACISYHLESCISIKSTSKKEVKAAAAQAAKKPDPKPKKGDIQPYADVITKEAQSDAGLFTVHKIDDSLLL